VLNALVIAFGTLIFAAGVWGLARPVALVAFVENVRKPGALWAIAAIRLVIGTVFLLAAGGSRSPLFLQVLGWVAIVSGLITPWFRGQRLDAWLGWWTARPPAFIRAWCALALAVGGAVIVAGT